MTSRLGLIPTFPSAIRRVLVLRVLKLLADAISRLQTCGGITSDMREDVISQNLYIAMEHIHQGSYDDIVNFALRPALPHSRPTPSDLDTRFYILFSCAAAKQQALSGG